MYVSFSDEFFKHAICASSIEHTNPLSLLTPVSQISTLIPKNQHNINSGSYFYLYLCVHTCITFLPSFFSDPMVQLQDNQ